jgi:hypothetical protein
MKSTLAAQTVFRYNDNSKNDQIMNDLVGTLPQHIVGDFVNRKGKRWKVAAVIHERTDERSNSIPLHRVFLTDRF